jgi:hypothetical protein
VSTLTEKKGNLKPQISPITQMMKAKGLPSADTSAAVDKTAPAKNLNPIRICVIGEICGLFSVFLLCNFAFPTNPFHPGEKNCRCFIREIASRGAAKWQLPADRQLGDPMHQ